MDSLDTMGPDVPMLDPELMSKKIREINILLRYQILKYENGF